MASKKGFFDLRTMRPRGGIFQRAPVRNIGIPVQQLDRRKIFPKPGSKTEAILADLIAGTMTSTAIAKKHRCSVANVSQAYRRAVAEGIMTLQKGGVHVIVRAKVGHDDALAELHQEATARGWNVEQLVRSIVVTVARKNLFDLVLEHGSTQKGVSSNLPLRARLSIEPALGKGNG